MTQKIPYLSVLYAQELVADLMRGCIVLVAIIGLLGELHLAAQQQVTSVSPSQGALNVSPSTTIVVTFNNPIDPATVNNTSFVVTGETSGPHSGNFAFASGNSEITFTALAAFKKGELFRIDVSNKIKDAANVPIRPFLSQFTTLTDSNAGEFAAGVTYGVGERPLSVFAYDLDGDGDLDLVVANSSVQGTATSKTISVLKNRGNGTFGPKTDYVSDDTVSTNCCGPGARPYTVYVSDVDGDGDGDIIVVNFGTFTVSVLFNDALGNFGSRRDIYPVAAFPVRVAVGDLDGDGHPDLVVTHGGSGSVDVLINQGDGTFAPATPYRATHATYGIALYDVDQDGDLDVVAANQFVNSVSVLLGNGDGTLQPPVSYPAGIAPRDLVVADLDGDGDGDIVVANQVYVNAVPPRGTGTITIWKNNGNGTFTDQSEYAVNGLPIGVSVSDVNGDGWPDIVTGNHFGGEVFSGSSVSIWMNGGGGAFTIRKDFNAAGSGPTAVAAADVDNDGDIDLVTANWLSDSVSVLKNAPAGITGMVYADLDGNCLQAGPDEGPVSERMVRLVDGSGVARYAASQSDGRYAFVVAAGSYTLSLVHNNTTQETCNNGQGIEFPVTLVGGATVTDKNFGLASDCSALVFCESRISWPCPPNSPVPCRHDGRHFRQLCPCEEFQYKVTVKNTGTAPLAQGSTVWFFLDPNVKFCSSLCFGAPTGGSAAMNPLCSPACNPINGQTVYWVLPQLAANNSLSCVVNVQVANVPLGTGLQSFPILFGSCPALGPPSVTAHNCVDKVECSVDPNDKQVTPQGCGPFGNILPGEPLTYRVRFQNTGSAPARRVLIRDHLDAALDAQTLEIVSTSHPYTSIEILPGNQLVWTFNGIDLPDNTSNEPASHGYVLFRVRPRPGLAEGTTILNTAAIYFDINAPVITMTTTNTIRSIPSPVAEFTAQRSSPSENLVYNFTYTGNTSDGTSFAWDFGPDANPSTSTNQAPAGIRFNSAGLKRITLMVERFGCTATKYHIIEVGRTEPCEGTPRLSIVRAAGRVIISWTECGILEEATKVTGPWSDLLATSPHTNSISPGQRFYRVRK